MRSLGLFETEVVFQSALVAGALSTEAAKGSDTPFDARIHELRGHRGQIETAAAIRRLMAGSPDPRLAPDGTTHGCKTRTASGVSRK